MFGFEPALQRGDIGNWTAYQLREKQFICRELEKLLSGWPAPVNIYQIGNTLKTEKAELTGRLSVLLSTLHHSG